MPLGTQKGDPCQAKGGVWSLGGLSNGLLKSRSATTIPGCGENEQVERYPVIHVSASPLPAATLNSQRVFKQEIVRRRLRGRRQSLSSQRIIEGPTTKPPRCVDRVKIEGGAGNRLCGPDTQEVTGHGAGRRQVRRHAGRLCSVVANGIESGMRSDIGVRLG